MTGTQTYYLLMIRGERARYQAGPVGKRTRKGGRKAVRECEACVYNVCASAYAHVQYVHREAYHHAFRYYNYQK